MVTQPPIWANDPLGNLRPQPARPFHPGHAPTSQEAYARVLKRLTPTLWRLYLWIEASGKTGMNCAELCAAIPDAVAQTISTRLSDMKRLGMLVHKRDRQGEFYRRMGDRGVTQLVYVTMPVGEWVPMPKTSHDMAKDERIERLEVCIQEALDELRGLYLRLKSRDQETAKTIGRTLRKGLGK